MRLKDTLNHLSPPEQERLFGRLEGMEMAMRICRNRAMDMEELMDYGPEEAMRLRMNIQRHEAEIMATMIRMVQVNIGNGGQPFGSLTEAEQEEIWRIY